jgi:hypothetical protein
MTAINFAIAATIAAAARRRREQQSQIPAPIHPKPKAMTAAMTAAMTNKEMTAALEDMLNKWNAAKAKAKLSHPEWSEDQINNAVGNAFTLQLVNK